MPKMFHGHHKNPPSYPPPTKYLVYGPLFSNVKYHKAKVQWQVEHSGLSKDTRQQFYKNTLLRFVSESYRDASLINFVPLQIGDTFLRIFDELKTD